MMSLKDRLLGLKSKPQRDPPKWGVERRRAIIMKMADPANRNQKQDVLRFVHKVLRASNMTHFFEVVANDLDMKHVEHILGIDQ